jgi:hypothetical protein
MDSDEAEAPSAWLTGSGLGSGLGSLPDSPQPPSSSKPGQSRSVATRYEAEIRFLSLLVEKHRRSTDANGMKACEFVGSKLADASRAIAAGDEEGAWFHLFGAASLCRSFEIDAHKVAQVIVRLNNLMK